MKLHTTTPNSLTLIWVLEKLDKKRNSVYADKYEKELYEDKMWDE